MNFRTAFLALAGAMTVACMLFFCVFFAGHVRAQEAVHHLVTRSAQSHGVPVRLAHAIIRIESGYRCGARNGHARGIGQVMPRTAAAVGVRGNLFDCATGLEASMRYLRQAIARAGAGCAGASLYNLGLYARPRCTSYGRRVMALAGLPIS